MKLKFFKINFNENINMQFSGNRLIFICFVVFSCIARKEKIVFCCFCIAYSMSMNGRVYLHLFFFLFLICKEIRKEIK